MAVDVIVFIVSILLSGAQCADDTATLEHSNNSLELKSILQTIDAAVENEQIFQVTLKVLQSLCSCMKENLKVKNNILFQEDENAINGDNKVNKTSLDIYKNIYKRTCFNVTNKMDSTQNDIIVTGDDWESDRMEYTLQDRYTTINYSHFGKIINTLFLSNDTKYRTMLKTCDLFENPLELNNSVRDSCIIIVTLCVDSLHSNDTLDEMTLKNTMRQTNAVEIAVMNTSTPRGLISKCSDTKYDEVHPCTKRSIYEFIKHAEVNKIMKNLKILRRNDSIKIYIEISTPCQNFTDRCYANNMLNISEEFNETSNSKKRVINESSLFKSNYIENMIKNYLTKVNLRNSNSKRSFFNNTKNEKLILSENIKIPVTTSNIPLNITNLMYSPLQSNPNKSTNNIQQNLLDNLTKGCNNKLMLMDHKNAQFTNDITTVRALPILSKVYGVADRNGSEFINVDSILPSNETNKQNISIEKNKIDVSNQFASVDISSLSSEEAVYYPKKFIFYNYVDRDVIPKTSNSAKFNNTVIFTKNKFNKVASNTNLINDELTTFSFTTMSSDILKVVNFNNFNNSIEHEDYDENNVGDKTNGLINNSLPNQTSTISNINNSIYINYVKNLTNNDFETLIHTEPSTLVDNGNTILSTYGNNMKDTDHRQIHTHFNKTDKRFDISEIKNNKSQRTSNIDTTFAGTVDESVIYGEMLQNVTEESRRLNYIDVKLNNTSTVKNESSLLGIKNDNLDLSHHKIYHNNNIISNETQSTTWDVIGIITQTKKNVSQSSFSHDKRSEVTPQPQATSLIYLKNNYDEIATSEFAHLTTSERNMDQIYSQQNTFLTHPSSSHTPATNIYDISSKNDIVISSRQPIDISSYPIRTPDNYFNNVVNDIGKSVSEADSVQLTTKSNNDNDTTIVENRYYKNMLKNNMLHNAHLIHTQLTTTLKSSSDRNFEDIIKSSPNLFKYTSNLNKFIDLSDSKDATIQYSEQPTDDIQFTTTLKSNNENIINGPSKSDGYTNNLNRFDELNELNYGTIQDVKIATDDLSVLQTDNVDLTNTELTTTLKTFESSLNNDKYTDNFNKFMNLSESKNATIQDMQITTDGLQLTTTLKSYNDNNVKNIINASSNSDRYNSNLNKFMDFNALNDATIQDVELATVGLPVLQTDTPYLMNTQLTTTINSNINKIFEDINKNATIQNVKLATDGLQLTTTFKSNNDNSVKNIINAPLNSDGYTNNLNKFMDLNELNDATIQDVECVTVGLPVLQKDTAYLINTTIKRNINKSFENINKSTSRNDKVTSNLNKFVDLNESKNATIEYVQITRDDFQFTATLKSNNDNNVKNIINASSNSDRYNSNLNKIMDFNALNDATIQDVELATVGLPVLQTDTPYLKNTQLTTIINSNINKIFEDINKNATIQDVKLATDGLQLTTTLKSNNDNSVKNILNAPSNSDGYTNNLNKFMDLNEPNDATILGVKLTTVDLPVLQTDTAYLMNTQLTTTLKNNINQEDIIKNATIQDVELATDGLQLTTTLKSNNDNNVQNIINASSNSERYNSNFKKFMDLNTLNDATIQDIELDTVSLPVLQTDTAYLMNTTIKSNINKSFEDINKSTSRNDKTSNNLKTFVNLSESKDATIENVQITTDDLQLTTKLKSNNDNSVQIIINAPSNSDRNTSDLNNLMDLNKLNDATIQDVKLATVGLPVLQTDTAYLMNTTLKSNINKSFEDINKSTPRNDKSTSILIKFANLDESKDATVQDVQTTTLKNNINQEDIIKNATIQDVELATDGLQLTTTLKNNNDNNVQNIINASSNSDRYNSNLIKFMDFNALNDATIQDVELATVGLPVLQTDTPYLINTTLKSNINKSFEDINKSTPRNDKSTSILIKFADLDDSKDATVQDVQTTTLKNNINQEDIIKNATIQDVELATDGLQLTTILKSNNDNSVKIIINAPLNSDRNSSDLNKLNDSTIQDVELATFGLPVLQTDTPYLMNTQLTTTLKNNINQSFEDIIKKTTIQDVKLAIIGLPVLQTNTAYLMNTTLKNNINKSFEDINKSISRNDKSTSMLNKFANLEESKDATVQDVQTTTLKNNIYQEDIIKNATIQDVELATDGLQLTTTLKSDNDNSVKNIINAPSNIDRNTSYLNMFMDLKNQTKNIIKPSLKNGKYASNFNKIIDLSETKETTIQDVELGTDYLQLTTTLKTNNNNILDNIKSASKKDGSTTKAGFLYSEIVPININNTTHFYKMNNLNNTKKNISSLSLQDISNNEISRIVKQNKTDATTTEIFVTNIDSDTNILPSIYTNKIIKTLSSLKMTPILELTTLSMNVNNDWKIGDSSIENSTENKAQSDNMKINKLNNFSENISSKGSATLSLTQIFIETDKKVTKDLKNISEISSPLHSKEKSNNNLRDNSKISSKYNTTETSSEKTETIANGIINYDNIELKLISEGLETTTQFFKPDNGFKFVAETTPSIQYSTQTADTGIDIVNYFINESSHMYINYTDATNTKSTTNSKELNRSEENCTTLNSLDVMKVNNLKNTSDRTLYSSTQTANIIYTEDEIRTRVLEQTMKNTETSPNITNFKNINNLKYLTESNINSKINYLAQKIKPYTYDNITDKKFDIKIFNIETKIKFDNNNNNKKGDHDKYSKIVKFPSTCNHNMSNENWTPIMCVKNFTNSEETNVILTNLSNITNFNTNKNKSKISYDSQMEDTLKTNGKSRNFVIEISGTVNVTNKDKTAEKANVTLTLNKSTNNIAEHVYKNNILSDGEQGTILKIPNTLKTSTHMNKIKDIPATVDSNKLSTNYINKENNTLNTTLKQIATKTAADLFSTINVVSELSTSMTSLSKGLKYGSNTDVSNKSDQNQLLNLVQTTANYSDYHYIQNIFVKNVSKSNHDLPKMALKYFNQSKGKENVSVLKVFENEKLMETSTEFKHTPDYLISSTFKTTTKDVYHTINKAIDMNLLPALSSMNDGKSKVNDIETTYTNVLNSGPTYISTTPGRSPKNESLIKSNKLDMNPHKHIKYNTYKIDSDELYKITESIPYISTENTSKNNKSNKVTNDNTACQTNIKDNVIIVVNGLEVNMVPPNCQHSVTYMSKSKPSLENSESKAKTLENLHNLSNDIILHSTKPFNSILDSSLERSNDFHETRTIKMYPLEQLKSKVQQPSISTSTSKTTTYHNNDIVNKERTSSVSISNEIQNNVKIDNKHNVMTNLFQNGNKVDSKQIVISNIPYKERNLAKTVKKDTKKIQYSNKQNDYNYKSLRLKQVTRRPMERPLERPMERLVERSRQPVSLHTNKYRPNPFYDNNIYHKTNLYPMKTIGSRPPIKIIKRIQLARNPKVQDYFGNPSRNFVKQLPSPPRAISRSPNFVYMNSPPPLVTTKLQFAKNDHETFWQYYPTYAQRRRLYDDHIINSYFNEQPLKRGNSAADTLHRPETLPEIVLNKPSARSDEPQQLVPITPETKHYLRKVFEAPLDSINPTYSQYVPKWNKDKENPVTDWWLDDMYLRARLPLPINSSPGMVFPRRHFAKLEEVADLAALFVDDFLDYKEMLQRGELPLERATSREKGQPLCMEQFYRLLGVCRIPELEKDRLVIPEIKFDEPVESTEELVIVACRNQLYSVAIRAADRGRLSPGELQAQLVHILVEASSSPAAPRVGLLTAMSRDNWARARHQLAQDENNLANLELISRALCVVCLDSAGGDRSDLVVGAEDTNALLRAMHGGGSQHHSANRWFDNTVQLIISEDGTVGMCYEHSAAEGVAVVRLAERALARAEVSARPAPPPALLPAPQPLNWNLTKNLEDTIKKAAADLDKQISDLDMVVYTYRGYGREFMKSCRTSPDVYIQLALQLAYYMMYGHLVSTYESASLRRFRGGRVDNIRSAHRAALDWVNVMCHIETPPRAAPDDGQKKVSFSVSEEQKKKIQLFEEAAKKQTTIMEANILGHGIDNHLLGLRELAKEHEATMPQIFTDPVYKQMMQFDLSTSQVATSSEGTFMGYGPVTPDGYGCSYNPKRDSVIFCISSFSSSRVTSTDAFRHSLEEALNTMRTLLQDASSAKS